MGDAYKEMNEKNSTFDANENRYDAYQAETGEDIPYEEWSKANPRKPAKPSKKKKPS